MVKIFSTRPTSALEKMQIAQQFANRLRALTPYPLKIFLVGSLANSRDLPYSDIDIRIINYDYGNKEAFRYFVQNLVHQIYHETGGVWIDAKIRTNVPFSLPGKRVVQI